jgi:uncharacterized protein (TIGR00369 family)
MADPAAEVIARMTHAVPQAHVLGFEVVEVSPERAVMRAPWLPQMVGDEATGVIAGGVVTTLIDHVAGLAVNAARRGEAGAIATLDLRIDYLRPAGERLGLTATASCYRLTRSVAFVRAEAHDGQGETPVATAQAAFMLGTPGGMVAP